MSNAKTLLVKGRAGMGNRILCLLGGILYSNITDRSLCVDWSDEAYSSDRTNIFSKLFTINQANYLKKIPNTDSVFPHIWKNHLDKSFEDLMQIYKLSGHDLVTVTPVIASKYSVNIARTNYQEDLLVRWSYFAEVHKLRRAFKGKFADLNNLTDKAILKQVIKKHLHLQPAIKNRLDNLKSQYFQEEPVIGVHIRHTDRKNSFNKYYKVINELIDKNPQSRIFLATDNPTVQKQFRETYNGRVFSVEKWFPDENSNLKRLHFNPDCPDKFENAVQALLDMYLLGSSKYLVCDQASTFSIVAELVSDIPTTNVIDTSRQSLKRNWKRIIWLMERWL